MKISPVLTRLLPLMCGVVLFSQGLTHAIPRLGGKDGSESEKPTGPRLPVAIDVVMERIDLAGKSEEIVGDDIINDDTKQTIRVAMFPQQTQSFLVHIKNNGQNANSFQVNLSGERSAQGATTEWKPKQWSCFAAVDGTTTNLLSELQSEKGWETPLIEPGGEVVLRLAFSTGEASDALEFWGSFRLMAHKDDTRDTVVGTLGVQFIRSVEWSVDFVNWQPVTEPIRVERHQAVGLRALGANPKIDWSEFLEFNPTWGYQETGQPTSGKHLGEMISLDTSNVGNFNFTAIGGNKISGQIVIEEEKDEGDD